MSVILETTLGDLTVDLFTDTHPTFCKSFLKLCKLKYYNNHLFFNVLANRFAQVGDPSATGSGGESVFSLLSADPSHRFIKDEGRALTPAELQTKGLLVSTKIDNRPNTHGSQFTVTTSGGPGRSLHEMGGTVTAGFRCFGRVSEDSDGVLDAVNALFLDDEGRPFTDVRVLHTVVLADPFPDPPGFEDLQRRFSKGWERRPTVEDFDVASPPPGRPSAEQLPQRISASLLSSDPSLLGTQDSDPEILARRALESRRAAAASRAVVLEMLGDVKSADAAPPERVLFVCKLNPVTTGEDLELVFSRFDDDVKADVIYDERDRTKSLCYAFVVFGDKAKCEAAYLKMDGALVDDRRIKVDFSQSSSGQWRKYEASKQLQRGGGVGGVGGVGGGGGGGSGSGNVGSSGNNAGRGGGQPPPPKQPNVSMQRTPPNKADDGGENRPLKSRWGPSAADPAPAQEQQHQPPLIPPAQPDKSERGEKRDRGRSRRSEGSDRTDSCSSSSGSRSSSRSSDDRADSRRRSRDRERDGSSSKKHKKDKKHKHKQEHTKSKRHKHEKKDKKDNRKEDSRLQFAIKRNAA